MPAIVEAMTPVAPSELDLVKGFVDVEFGHKTPLGNHLLELVACARRVPLRTWADEMHVYGR